jgi:peptidoglycan/LPS O-acetylase OafA/YrhL
MQRVDHLTFTRFIAALPVLVFHYGREAFPFTLPVLNALTTRGGFVTYFFVLSGFTMALVYFRPGTEIRPIRYWYMRLTRIYPVYLFALILTLALDPATRSGYTAIALNLGMLQAWFPPYPLSLNYTAWFLSAQAFCYLVFPVFLWVAYRAPFKAMFWGIVVIWAVSLAVNTYLFNTRTGVFWSHVIYYNPLMHLGSFLLGSLGGRWWSEYGRNYSPNPKMARVMLFASLAVFVLVFFFLNDFIRLLGFPYRFATTTGVFSPFFALIMIALSYENGWISALFRSPLFVLLGNASYASYILQAPVHAAYQKYLLPLIPNLGPTGTFFLYYLILVLVAVLTFKLLEAPLRDLAKHIYQRSFLAQRGW